MASADLRDLARRVALIAAEVDILARATPSPVHPNVVALPFFFTKDAQRAKITRKVFAHYRDLATRFDLQVVGVGSEGDTSRSLWCEYFDPANYQEYPQTWTGTTPAAGSAGLRAKFDETVRAARRFDPARVFIGGSDDVITAPFFQAAFASDADLVGIGAGDKDAVNVVRLARHQVFEWDGRYKWAPDLQFCGGGLVLSRSLLDEWDWAPFSGEGDEVWIERRAREDGAVLEALYPRDGFRFWAVKCEKAILNGWRQVAKIVGSRSVAEKREEFDVLWAGL